jgi:hypothetical protein
LPSTAIDNREGMAMTTGQRYLVEGGDEAFRGLKA